MAGEDVCLGEPVHVAAEAATKNQPSPGTEGRAQRTLPAWTHSRARGTAVTPTPPGIPAHTGRADRAAAQDVCQGGFVLLKASLCHLQIM